ncbi:ATP-dependent DNA helicase DDM1-like isoform X2 [Cornus florida]|uniref:ATP-dependent DNA helicase DDM1-like isoform X2 n=1 Tax=Cornus florida TaxID=4283 RepID=UPI00289D2672|nr:ATP-dependent DNA helicase DDM1-like isoform X2 [Cornus florida]
MFLAKVNRILTPMIFLSCMGTTKMNLAVDALPPFRCCKLRHPDVGLQLVGTIHIGSESLYPSVEQKLKCGKFHLLDRWLAKLFPWKHKVLIFWCRRSLDILDYDFSEKGFEVCRIGGSVKLSERKRQIKEFND